VGFTGTEWAAARGRRRCESRCQWLCRVQCSDVERPRHGGRVGRRARARNASRPPSAAWPKHCFCQVPEVDVMVARPRFEPIQPEVPRSPAYSPDSDSICSHGTGPGVTVPRRREQSLTVVSYHWHQCGAV